MNHRSPPKPPATMKDKIDLPLKDNLMALAQIKVYHGNELVANCPNFHDKPVSVPASIWNLFVDRENSGTAYGWSFIKEV